MLYLYALVQSLGAPPAARGLHGRPLELVALGPLAAVVSRHGELDQELATDALMAHAAVVAALMAETPDLVPVRFGAVFENESSLRTAAAARMSALEGVLENVRGRLEFGLHVVRRACDPEQDEQQDGRGRLLRKLEQLRIAESASRLDGPLVELAVESRRRRLRTPRLLLSAAYLVARERAPAFSEQAHAIVERRPEGLEVLATGPWPPYSFAQLEDDLRAA